MFDYPVTLTPDDGTVLVTFPDVPARVGRMSRRSFAGVIRRMPGIRRKAR